MLSCIYGVIGFVKFSTNCQFPFLYANRWPVMKNMEGELLKPLREGTFSSISWYSYSMSSLAYLYTCIA